jgi:hypothetical protein
MMVFDVNSGADGAESAQSIGIAEGSGEANCTRTSEFADADSPSYRRPGILIAAAALIAGVGIVMSGPGTAPGGTTGTSTPRSASFLLVSTDILDPLPAPPPPAPPAPAPPAPEPPAVVYRPAPTQEWVPPPPPPPPPPQLVMRLDNPITAAFVSITNNAQPAVGCVMRTVPLAGTAAMVNFSKPDDNFTVTGSEESRIPAGSSIGPATGSSFRLTVTCDNGLSTSMDATY